MFRSTWSWVVPLIGAAAVFSGVLLTTPPGFRAISDVLFASPRGPNADAVAYALGSAASLALVTLGILGAALGGIDLMLRHGPAGPGADLRSKLSGLLKIVWPRVLNR